MKAWLAETVTRAEAIAWGLLVPSLALIGVSGAATVKAVQIVRRTPSNLEAPYTPLLSVSLTVGEAWLGIMFIVMGVLVLLALLTKQRPWVRVAAPVVLGLLAWALQREYSIQLREWLAVGLYQFQEQAAGAPR